LYEYLIKNSIKLYSLQALGVKNRWHPQYNTSHRLSNATSRLAAVRYNRASAYQDENQWLFELRSASPSTLNTRNT
jgi:hypothetical protein